MSKLYHYDTVTEAVSDLDKRGYTIDFTINVQEECLVCNKLFLQLSPDDFEIDEVHRFEGNSDPGDEMIVFAISSHKYNIKGIVINAYGIYSDATTSMVVERLKRQL